MPTACLAAGVRRSQVPPLQGPLCLRALQVSLPPSVRTPVSGILIFFGWRYQKRGSKTPEPDILRLALPKKRVPHFLLRHLQNAAFSINENINALRQEFCRFLPKDLN